MSENLVRALVTIGLAALAGGLTNTVAIWMLFRPYEPPKVLGKWRLRFFQGAVPKNHSKLAAAIGRTVGNRLLTPEDLTNTFAEVEFREAFDQKLADLVSEILNKKRGSLREMIPEDAMGEVESLIDQALQVGLGELEEYVLSEAFDEAAARRTTEVVEAIRDEPIATSITPDRQAAIKASVDGWIRKAIDSDGFRAVVEGYLNQAALKVLQPGRTFEDILPLGLTGSVEKVISSYLPLAAERLSEILDDPKARARFEAIIHDLLQRFLKDLKLHQRVLARFVMTEDTIEKVLNTIENDGAEQLSEILNDPVVQDAMARGVNEAIVDFLRRAVTEVVGEPSDPTVTKAISTLSDLTVKMTRDPDTYELIVEKLYEEFDNAGSRTWGEMINHVPDERISEALVDVARTDLAHKVLKAGARRLIIQILEKPIGTPARWLPSDSPARIEAALADPIWEWLQAQVPTIVERIDVARRVEDKVSEFPTERMEQIVRNVTHRELRVIVHLGYAFGAIIGGVVVLFDTLTQ